MQDCVEQRDGGYYIAGTRLALDSIVLAFQDGESPETILQSFPMAGTLVRVNGAIVFYLENHDKVEAYLSDQERLWAEVKAKDTKLPEALFGRLQEARKRCVVATLNRAMPLRWGNLCIGRENRPNCRA